MKKNILLIGILSLLIFVSCGNTSKNNSDMAIIPTINDENKTTSSIRDTTHYNIQSGKVLPADSIETARATLYITLLGHASLMLEYQGKIIYIDPYSAVIDFSKLPKADYIILTHEHPDHFDKSAINTIKKTGTKVMGTKVCNESLGYSDIIENGVKTAIENILIEAVPAYNIVNKTSDGNPYHPKGRGNGYIFNFDYTRIYVAGDTENIPEMDALKGTIDIAFLPKNLPYTMTDEMFVDAVKKIEPKILYPYHFSDFNEKGIRNKLGDNLNVEIRVRPMKNK